MVLTLDVFLKICAGFTAMCVSGGWLIKIIRAVKAPVDDVTDQIDTNVTKIKTIEEELQHLSDSIALLMRCDLVMLGHMRTNNNTGQIAAMESDIQNFLIER